MEFQDNSADIITYLMENHHFRKQGKHLIKGECPVCKKREAWTKVERPHYIYCNRKNNCGEVSKTYDYFPHLYKSVTERFESKLEEDPNAVAKAYLQESRGFSPNRIAGWFEQSWINNPQGKNPKGRSGVFAARFPIAEGVFFERFVEGIHMPDPDGILRYRPNRIVGTYKGKAYQPPMQQIKAEDTVYITEAVLKTIALEINGYKSISSLSSSHFPEDFINQHTGKNIHWVLAMDNDQAGLNATTEHVKRLRDMGERVTAILPYKGSDWDDLHKQGKLTEADFKNFEYYGALHIAESREEKANIMFSKTGSRFFIFNHARRMHCFELNGDNEKAYDAITQELIENEPELTQKQQVERALSGSKVVDDLSNCEIEFLYSQANPVTDELFYFFQVRFPDGRVVQNTMTGNQLDSNGDFRKRMISMAAGAMWWGDAPHLTWLKKTWTRDIKVVETQMFAGYNKDKKAYIYNDIAVKDGRVYHKNQHDFFNIGKMAIKGIGHNVSVDANPNMTDYSTEWWSYMYRSFGTKSIVALTFWLGALFAEQIRSKHKSYPFLEMIGEGGSGKSTLLEFMWKLIGRENYEGFNPSKNTGANVARNFDSLSNLPVALIEADHEDDAIKGAKQSRWNWDDLKDSWNGRPIRGRAVKTNGNEILEQPFRGAIVIVQNPPVNAERPILQRITHLEFDQSTHSKDSYEAAKLLESFPAEKCSGWLIKCITQESEIMQLFHSKVDGYIKQILMRDDVKEIRIAKNHGQIRALLDCLKLVTPISEGQYQDAANMIMEMSAERQKACSDDHPIIDEFWEIYEYLDSVSSRGGMSMADETADMADYDDPDLSLINQHTKDGFIAVNLPHFERIARDYGQQIPEMGVLKRYLKSSKKYKFVAANKAVHSSHTHKPVKCWIFSTPNQSTMKRAA